jgi:protein arginine kinase activator
MLCSQCHEREAVVFLTQIAQDQVIKLHLCERCAAEKGVETASSVSQTPVGAFLASMGQSIDLTGTPGLAPSDACPECGATLSDFKESGRLGCAACYYTFERPLRDLLRRLHGSSRHLGHRYLLRDEPAAADNGPDPGELRVQLRAAIAAEQFERAAELRDRLRALEGEG